MTKGQLDNAIRRALNILDVWNDVTGAVPEESSWYYELQSVVEDAVHCGAQAYCNDYKLLEVESCYADMKAMESKLAAQEADGAAARDLIQHLGEYWNGNNNDRAMQDACEHTVEECTQFLARPHPGSRLLDLRELVEGLPKLDSEKIKAVRSAMSVPGTSWQFDAQFADALCALLQWRGKD